MIRIEDFFPSVSSNINEKILYEFSGMAAINPPPYYTKNPANSYRASWLGEVMTSGYRAGDSKQHLDKGANEWNFHKCRRRLYGWLTDRVTQDPLCLLSVPRLDGISIRVVLSSLWIASSRRNYHHRRTSSVESSSFQKVVINGANWM